MEGSRHSLLSVSDRQLDNSCVVTSEKSNIQYCTICMTQTDPIAWQEHQKKPIHVNTLQRFDLFFREQENCVYCKACGIKLDWVSLMTHANSHKITPWYIPRDVYKTLVENHLIERETEFYCKPCEVFLPNLHAASHHVANDKHQRLMKSILSPKNTVISKDSDVSHNPLTQTKSERLECDSSIVNVIEKNIDESAETSDSPCLFVTSVDTNKYRCRICTKDVFGRGSVESHVIGTRHRQALQKYGCDYISHKDHGYYCRCCDLTLSSCELAFLHIEQEAHMANWVHSFCISLLSMGKDRFRCTICNIYNCGRKNLETHINGMRHASLKLRYGCKYISLEDNVYFCRCCDLKMTSRELASEHIKQSEHINAVYSVTFVGKNQFHCGNRKIDSNTMTDFQSHVNGEQHQPAQKQYVCEYISLKNNVYYCTCCDLKLSSRKLAFDHIKEEKHLNISNLTCISVTYVAINQLHCTICDVVSNSKTDLQMHVDGQRHRAAQNKYGCEYISLKNNAYYCACCDLNMTNRELASHHIKVNEHTSVVHSPCISITFVGMDQFHCGICNFDGRSGTDLQSHVNGTQHQAAQKLYGCEYISLKDNVYYCTCCDLKLSSRKLASDHIEEEKHLIVSNLTCISVTYVAINQLHCTICDVVSNSKTDLQMHVDGQRHRAAQNKYGCEYISLKNNAYYCACCDLNMTNRELASNHIKENEHISVVHSPCISVTFVGMNQFHCDICNVDSNNETILQSHVNEKRHQAAQKQYGCEYISLKNNVYYCSCCDLTLSSRKLASDHIKEQKHLIIINFTCISVTYVAINELHCTICNVVSNSKTDLQNHVNGQRHRTAQKKYGCEYILLKNNGYYCTCCDLTLSSRNLASDHVKERKHLSITNFTCIFITYADINQFHCKICKVVSNSETDLQSHVNGEQHRVAQKQYGCKYISLKNNAYYCTCCDLTLSSRKLAFFHIKAKKHLSNTHFICISITYVDMNQFHCRICNLDLNNRQDIQAHVNEQRHAAAWKKYGCDQILLKDNVYHCQCCDLDLPNRELASAHIEEEKHKVSMGILQKDEETTSDEISNYSSSPDPSEQEPENYNCPICDCTIVGKSNFEEHVGGRRHKTGLQIFHENRISFNDNKYRCEYCNCSIYGRSNVSQHIAGERHHNCVKSYLQQGTKNSETIRQPLYMKTGKSEIEASKKTRAKTDVSHNAGSKKKIKKSKKVKKMVSEKGPMECRICHVLLKGAENYHTHLAEHFCKDFVESEENNEIEKEKDSIDSSELQSTNGSDVTKTDSTNGSDVTKTETPLDLPNRVISEKTIFDKRIEKSFNMRWVIKQLEIDADDIYTMEDKLADIELGMKLCYEIHKNMIHCLVCQKVIACTMKNYHEHLRGSEHCKNLDEMEEDAELFKNLYEESSQLELALHYMQDESNHLVCCFACNVRIDDSDDKIRNHMNNGRHIQNCTKLWINAKENFNQLQLTQCDWYGIQTYWCVTCAKKYKSEVDFVDHLDSKDHKNVRKRDKNRRTKLMFDFCEACAILWYGYRGTWSYHRDTQQHAWLTRDGYHTLTEIPKFAEELLRRPEECANEIVKQFDDVAGKQREKEQTLMRDMEKAVRTKYPRARAYIFGSRVTGLGSADSDIDVFLDCENMYDGESTSMTRVVNYMTVVEECLKTVPECWDVEEVLTMCRTPIIRAHHRFTGLSCDISFENGLAVENTMLIKYLTDIFPPCRKIILVLKEWLKLCELSGSKGVTNYALYWYVIFFLQKQKILPSIATLIRMNKTSRVIAGWEVGVSRDLTFEELECGLSIKELLRNFFTFYANFDYRRNVACPLMGEVVGKLAFAVPRNLPKEMEPYKLRVENGGCPFRIDSIMCIQDPFDLQHNLSKAVSKVYCNRFRKFCSNSAYLLDLRKNMEMNAEQIQLRDWKLDSSWIGSTFSLR